jgi:hypothetical protein
MEVVRNSLNLDPLVFVNSGLIVIGLITSLRSAGNVLYHYAEKTCLSTVHVRAEDPLYEDIVRWMNDHTFISARTGQNITATEFGIPIKTPSPFSTFQPYFAQEICDLHDKSPVREILNRFFASSSFRLSFPILDQVLFEETVETAYKPMERNSLPAPHISAKACVLSALSLTSRFYPARKNPFSMDADKFAAKAHYLLMHITGYTSLETLQALLMLVSTAMCHSLQIYRLIWLFSNYDVYSMPTGKALPSFIRLRIAQSAP